MPPYRANLGGVFGSGLYDRNRPTNGAAEIIDAATQGASTLIHGAYQRHLVDREQARLDADQALRTQEQGIRQQTETREQAHDAWEKTRFEADQGWRRMQQSRQDAQEGYTPAHSETTSDVTDGGIEDHGLLGAPPHATAPTATSITQTIPGAYDFAASKEGKIEKMKLDALAAQRVQRLSDQKDLINYREGLRAARAKAGSDSPTVHAATEVARQITANNTAMKALQAQRATRAPAQLPQDVAPARDLDDQIGVFKNRGDSLSTVNDRIGAKLNDAAGVADHFVYDIFCDWYVEITKPIFQSGGEAAKAETRATTAWARDQILKLLHPFMPFITEELWAETATTPRETLLVLAQGPPNTAPAGAEAASIEMNWVIELIKGVRSVRAEMNLPAGAQVPLVLTGASA